MSKDVYEKNGLLITRFWGGEHRGPCLQINVLHNSYVVLTRAEWRAMVEEVESGGMDKSEDEAGGPDLLSIEERLRRLAKAIRIWKSDLEWRDERHVWLSEDAKAKSERLLREAEGGHDEHEPDND